MWEFIKKSWDIISGTFAGVFLAIISKFRLATVQLYYSIIILILVSIGVMRMVKQAVEKQRNKRHSNIIDGIVDGQKPVKAISLAQEPTKEGEKLGNLIIIVMGGLKAIMEKLKVWFDKFKGYILTGALAVLTAIEMCGGFINDAFKGALTIKGVEILPIITLLCTVVVGIISNGWTKEQKEQIKALFSKSSTSELVTAEIKKNIKEKTHKLTEFNKILATKETELANLQTVLASRKDTKAAKDEMFAMIPQLATAEDVQLAANEVVNAEAKIVEKVAEIEETKKTIENLQTMVNALKSQL